MMRRGIMPQMKSMGEMTNKLADIAHRMVAPGKGILAADESTGSIEKRFDSIKIPNTEDNRRDYREMLFSSRDAVRNMSQASSSSMKPSARTPERHAPCRSHHWRRRHARHQGRQGSKAAALHHGETVTEGLDGLAARVKEYYGLGARFAKWRAVIDIGDGKPSHNAIHANAHALARYAAICQEGGIVPIVEPEVLMDGDHDIDTCMSVSEWVLKEVYQELYYADVKLEGIDPETQHGHLRQEMPNAGLARGSRRKDLDRPQALRAASRAGHRLPVGRPVGAGGNRPSPAHERRGPPALAPDLLLWPRLQAAALKAWAGKDANVAGRARPSRTAPI